MIMESRKKQRHTRERRRTWIIFQCFALYEEENGMTCVCWLHLCWFYWPWIWRRWERKQKRASCTFIVFTFAFCLGIITTSWHSWEIQIDFYAFVGEKEKKKQRWWISALKMMFFDEQLFLLFSPMSLWLYIEKYIFLYFLFCFFLSFSLFLRHNY